MKTLKKCIHALCVALVLPLVSCTETRVISYPIPGVEPSATYEHAEAVCQGKATTMQFFPGCLPAECGGFGVPDRTAPVFNFQAYRGCMREFGYDAREEEVNINF